MNQELGKTDYIDKLALIEIRDKKLLLALSRGKDTWYLPGGKREAGETDQQALHREIKEELGVVLDPSTVRHFKTYEAQAHGKSPGTLIRLACYSGSYTGEPIASAEIEKIDYFTYSQRDKTSESTKLLMKDLKAEGLIE